MLEHTPPNAVALPYFPKAQIELVKQIRESLVNMPSQYTSVEQLSREYQISVSQLQKIFKRLYGVPIYQYARE